MKVIFGPFLCQFSSQHITSKSSLLHFSPTFNEKGQVFSIRKYPNLILENKIKNFEIWLRIKTAYYCASNVTLIASVIRSVNISATGA